MRAARRTGTPPGRPRREIARVDGVNAALAQRIYHALHGLAGSALDQIVQRRNDNRAPRDAILGHADECHVGTAYMPGLRCFAEWKDMHKRLLQIEL